MMRVGPRGFTLFETMIVLFLSATVLGMVGALMQRSFRALDYLQQKGQTLQAVTLAGERLASEMTEMVEHISSGGGSTRFRKVNPGAVKALGNVMGDIAKPPENWDRDYGTLNELVTVEYRHEPSSKRVLRSVTASGSTRTHSMAETVSGFSVAANHGGLTNSFEIKLTVIEDARVVNFARVVVCPGLDF